MEGTGRLRGRGDSKRLLGVDEVKKSGKKEEHSKLRRLPETGAKGQGIGEQELFEPQRGGTE